MNIGSILGSISPAAGIASGQGLFGKAMPFMSPLMALMHAGQGGGHGHASDPEATGAITPPPVQSNAPPAVPAPQTVAPPGPPAAPMGKQPAAPAAAPQTGGLHGIAFGGKPNLQGILPFLQMMAPGGGRF